jgi:hypothetical protein
MPPVFSKAALSSNPETLNVFYVRNSMKEIRAQSGAALICLLFLLCFSSCEQPAGVTLDSDAALKSLDLSSGNLTPPFSPETTAYTVAVGYGVDSVTVTAAPGSAKAVVSSGGGDRPLDVGPNRIDITVKAENGQTTKTYTVTVTRLDGSVSVINTAEEFSKIGRDEAYPLAGSYFLDSDLELENWTPIGENGENAFTGKFDGNRKKITVKSFAESVFGEEGDVFIGLFGYVKGAEISKALIKGLTVRIDLDKTISAKASYYVGAVAGYADEYTELDNIIVEGSINFSNTNTERPKRPVHVGGITGALIASELKNSTVSADITGFGTAGNGAYNYVGGLAGIFDRNAVNTGLNPAVIAGAPFAGASITNCRSTGNVSGSTEGAGTNVFAGGIAGGSRYGFKTYYSGKIEDCYSTGNVTASGGGYWSWAGGIAGTICGDGHDDPDVEGAETPSTGPTRIARCYAAGAITAGGPQGSWPYAGGITGYNYYGSLVSQCWFDGAVRVEGDQISDYTGGIAGYNSKQYYGHSSRIEDCWSAGSVEGYLNAGGIVGQNQVAAITERCYSTALVAVRAGQDSKGNMAQQGAGGIAGYNSVTDGRAAGTVRNCAALNPSIVSGGGFDLLHRVVGNGDGDHINNLARADMEVIIGKSPSPSNDKGVNGKDGRDIAAPPPQAGYVELGWDFDSVWKMGGSGYPVLQWQ